jgi:hypothetical protein
VLKGKSQANLPTLMIKIITLSLGLPILLVFLVAFTNNIKIEFFFLPFLWLFSGLAVENHRTFLTQTKYPKENRCKCQITTPQYRKADVNRVEIRPWDKKLIIFSQRGVLNLHSQSFHALSTFPVTLVGGLTVLCLCGGVPRHFCIYFGQHSLTEVRTTRVNTRFFILHKSKSK